MTRDRFNKGYSLVIHQQSQLSRYLPAIADAGFDGIEPTFLDGALPSPQKHTEQATQLRSICDDLGLAIPSLRAGRVPWGTIPADNPGERSLALDHTRMAFESMAIMGATALLVVPGLRTPDVDYQTHWKRVVEYGVAVSELAAEFGMTVGFENVEARFPVSELDWKALLDEIDKPNVGMYLDVGNILWLGFGYPEQWIRTLDHRVVRVHFKDAAYRLHGATLHSEIRQLLDGDVNWPAVMAALDDVSYEGWISVEPEPYPHLQHLLPRHLSENLDEIFQLPVPARGRPR